MRSLFILLFFISLLFAQERVLLRIGENGLQEAIPLLPGEMTHDVIERLESRRGNLSDRSTESLGLIDTLRYFGNENALSTNFGFLNQDVALQWYLPSADGIVKEVWWRNYESRGALKKGTIRAWHVNPKLLVIPTVAVDGRGKMGFYPDTSDGFGSKTPFKDEATDTLWHLYSSPDTIYHGFDPLGTEAQWLPGGLTVTLDSNAWQGIALATTGDSLKVKGGEPFGFTLMNISDQFQESVRMEILSTPTQSPYHSLKFYETTFTGEKYGWQLRSYEWGMYVVVEYTTCRPPKLVITPPGPAVSPGSRTLCVSVNGFDCATSSDSLITLVLYHRIGGSGPLDSSFVIMNSGTHCFELPKIGIHDTLYYYLKAHNKGIATVTPVRSFILFTPKHKTILLYNDSRFSLSTARQVYAGFPDLFGFDSWSLVNDGTKEIGQLLSMYQGVLIAEGHFPARKIDSSLSAWLSSASETSKRFLMLSSEGLGCSGESQCADSVFGPGNWIYDFLGVEKIGPRNLPPFERPHRLIVEHDTVTQYVLAFGQEHIVDLWYDPRFNLGFAGSMDAVTPRSGAKVLFREGKESLPVGIKFTSENVSTLFTAFDIGGLMFRSDTTSVDYEWWWINDIQPLARSFFASVMTTVDNIPAGSPATFRLMQNYPNPFNPVTTIEYSLPTESEVTISIFNTLGQRVESIVKGRQSAGAHRTVWDASRRASGLYFYELRAGNYRDVRKMLLLR